MRTHQGKREEKKGGGKGKKGRKGPYLWEISQYEAMNQAVESDRQTWS